ncbi:MAG TPA: NAD(P)H-dependent oxidoreductase subunit E [Alkalispirochaeta sp.]|nr:NAD(P)H-dependent oxidoreductase subunit E [Alkalispirochaeta sp.]
MEVGRCFGACGLAPVVVVDDDVHQRVKPAKIHELLAAYTDQNDGEVHDEA